MNAESDGRLVNLARKCVSKIEVSVRAWIRRPLWIYALIFFLVTCLYPALQAQQPATQEASTNSSAEQIAALQLAMTNAWQRVDAIVNQPVQAYVKAPGYRIGLSKPGWFDPGAPKPDFDTIDVRQTQEFPYTNYQYMTSDLNPGIMFASRDLEFNEMTKYFYTNRSLPKHRLTEAEMLEINKLYRVIGHCQDELNQLQNPAVAETASSSDIQSDGKPAAFTGAIENIRRIPQQRRILYGGIAIGVLAVLIVGLRLVRKNSS